MPTKVTPAKSKATPVRRTTVSKLAAAPMVAEKSMPVAPAGTRFWLTLAGLIAGGISFIGFVLLSNLTVTLSENVQIISIFALSAFAIGGLVVSILAILPGKEGGTLHPWLGLNIIAFGISFLMFDKFVSPLISVINYLLTKKAA